MPDVLPHADEIRTLREQVTRSNRAKALLPEIESALTSLALGGGSVAADSVRAELDASWSELDLTGELFEDLTRARAVLHQVVAAGERATRQMNDLLHHQAAALRSDAYKEIRDEINDLGDKRTALAASVAPLATARASFEPLIGTVRAQLDDVDPSAPAGRARLVSLLMSCETVVRTTAIDLDVPQPRPDVETPELLTLARDFQARLEAMTATIQERHDALIGELTAIENRIRARTG